MGFKRCGFKQIGGYLIPFSRIPRWCSGPPEKGEKGRKKSETGRIRPICSKGGRTLLKTPFVTPPFAAPPRVLEECTMESLESKIVGVLQMGVLRNGCLSKPDLRKRPFFLRFLDFPGKRSKKKQKKGEPGLKQQVWELPRVGGGLPLILQVAKQDSHKLISKGIL